MIQQLIEYYVDNCRMNCLESSQCQYYKVDESSGVSNCSLFNALTEGDLCQPSTCDQGYIIS